MKLIIFLTIIVTLSACKGVAVLDSISANDVSNIFLNIEAEKVDLLGKNIMQIYQDKKGNYWFASWEDGLYKYDGKTMLHYSTKNGFPNDRIDEIKEDNSGNIYFNTSNGVIQSDGEIFQLLEVSNDKSDWKLEANDLWFKDGWDSGSILRYDGKTLHKLTLPKNQIGEDYVFKNPNFPNPYTVYTIYKDSRGNMWFGTAALGSFRYDGKSFDWILEKDVAEIFNDPSEGANGVRSIIEDKEGYFWFNSKFRYKVYDRNDSISKDLIYRREESIGNLDGKVESNFNEYLSIAKDNNDYLWIVTYTNGVYQVDGNSITHHEIKENNQQIKLFSIYKDNSGQLWIGTHESGVYKLKGELFEKFKP